MIVDETVNSVVNNLADRIGSVTPKIENVATTVVQETSRLAGVQCAIGYGLAGLLCTLSLAAMVIIFRIKCQPVPESEEAKKERSNMLGTCSAAVFLAACAGLFIAGITTATALPEYLAPTKSVIESMLFKKQ